MPYEPSMFICLDNSLAVLYGTSGDSEVWRVRHLMLLSSSCFVCFDDFLSYQHDDDIGRELSVSVNYVVMYFLNDPKGPSSRPSDIFLLPCISLLYNHLSSSKVQNYDLPFGKMCAYCISCERGGWFFTAVMLV